MSNTVKPGGYVRYCKAFWWQQRVRGCSADCVRAFKPVIGGMLQLPACCQQEKPSERLDRDSALTVSADLCSHLALITLTREENLHQVASAPSCHIVWFSDHSLQGFRAMANLHSFPGQWTGLCWLCVCLSACVCSLSRRGDDGGVWSGCPAEGWRTHHHCCGAHHVGR